MNRLFKIILFITLAGGLFFSCSNEDNSQSQVMILALNNSNANASKTMAETQVSGKAYVSVSLETKSRTIMNLPDFVNDDSFSFTLSQKTSSFGERTIKTWETTETRSAYVQMTTEKEIAVDYAENGCDFYLSAYKGNVTYKSSVHVNKVSSGEKISLVFPEFYLSSTTNEGRLKVKLYFPKDSGVSTVKVNNHELEILTDDTENYVIYDIYYNALYSKNNYHYIEFYLYDQAGNFLNSFREIVILTGDCYAERHIQDVNKIHQIFFDKPEFNYREIECNDSIYFSEYETVVLETPKCGNFDFAGWYDNPDFTGEAITGWNPGEKTENIRLYPKFIASSLYYALSVLDEPGTYTIISDDIDKWGKLSDSYKTSLLKNLSNNSIFVELIIRESPKYSLKDLKCLQSAKISSGVTEIGKELFSDCTGLTSIEIPEGVTSIGDDAFRGCTGLTSIEIPEGVTSIGGSAFRGCTGLTSIEIPEGVTSIGGSAFSGCTGLTSIDLPEGITSIDYSAFSGCTGLTDIKLPTGITSIENSAFSGCTGLTSIELPNSITGIGDSAFKDCTALTSIKLPEDLKGIGEYAFDNCSSLVSLVIPESVTYLWQYALRNCTNLRTLTIPGNVRCKYTYYQNNVSSSKYYPLGICGLQNLKELIITGSEIRTENKIFGKSPNCFYGSPFEQLSGLESVIISDTVTSIGNCAFYGCTGLTSVTLKDPTGWSGGLSDDDEENARLLRRGYSEKFTKQGGSN